MVGSDDLTIMQVMNGIYFATLAVSMLLAWGSVRFVFRQQIVDGKVQPIRVPVVMQRVRRR
jgi:hypothetical protein